MSGRLGRLLIALAGSLAATLPAALPACAHPHVWIAATTDLVFDESGRVAAVRHQWVFDAMYSGYAVLGLE